LETIAVEIQLENIERNRQNNMVAFFMNVKFRSD
jgi:hypothetical protein